MLPELSDPVRGPWPDHSDQGLWSLLGASDRSPGIVVCLCGPRSMVLVFWLGHGSGDRDLLARIVIPCSGGSIRLGFGDAGAVLGLDLLNS